MKLNMKPLPLLERLGPGLRLTVALFLALALLISLAAAPVAAAEKPSDHQYKPRNDNDNNNNNNRHNNNNRNNKNNGGGGAFEIAQDFEQETESGDVEQSFNVSNTGDNSNQCANVNGTTNTGNLETQSGSIQFASDIDEFEQEDIGSELSVSGDSTVTCDQQVNQAASASADDGSCTWSGGWCYWSTDSSWWYWDGAAWWGPYSSHTTVRDMATGALGAMSGLTPLIILGIIATAGTGGLLYRRNGRRG
jgi:hypothetical protein